MTHISPSLLSLDDGLTCRLRERYRTEWRCSCGWTCAEMHGPNREPAKLEPAFLAHCDRDHEGRLPPVDIERTGHGEWEEVHGEQPVVSARVQRAAVARWGKAREAEEPIARAKIAALLANGGRRSRTALGTACVTKRLGRASVEAILDAMVDEGLLAEERTRRPAGGWVRRYSLEVAGQVGVVG